MKLCKPEHTLATIVYHSVHDAIFAFRIRKKSYLSDEELVEHINELVKENQTPADCPAYDDDEKSNLTADALGQVSLPEKRISSLLIQISLVQMSAVVLMLNMRLFQEQLASSLTLVRIHFCCLPYLIFH